MDSSVAEQASVTSAAQSLFLNPYWALYDGITTSSASNLQMTSAYTLKHTKVTGLLSFSCCIYSAGL